MVVVERLGQVLFTEITAGHPPPPSRSMITTTPKFKFELTNQRYSSQYGARSISMLYKHATEAGLTGRRQEDCMK